MVTQRMTRIFVATLVSGASMLTACSSSGNERGVATPAPPASASAVASPDATESRSFVLLTLDPVFDSSHRITMDLADGYTGGGIGGPVFGTDEGQGLTAWIVGNVYAEPCRWVGTLLDPRIEPTVDALVAGLTSQKSRHASAPTDVTLDGFTGQFMELTVPARIDLADCDEGQFRTWVDHTLVGARNLEPGQRDLLWIVDVDGTRLVIDSALGPETTPKDRADRIQMVESIRIEPVWG